MSRAVVAGVVGALALAFASSTAVAAPRSLPRPSERPAARTGIVHVDPIKGNDSGDGSDAKPWKTLDGAAKHLKPGDTLYLHGGTYFETATLAIAGTAAAPITIRSAPHELAIIDGGLREFEDAPAKAWEPAPGGAPGEMRSTATYPDVNKQSADDRNVWVVGNFADTMVPLHGYRLDVDLRSANQYWNLPDKGAAGNGIYVGPGVWFDWQTHRIHARLAHTSLKSQGDANYAGETDPRKVPLVIGIDRTPLRLDRVKYVRLQDVVIRGSAQRTVEIVGCDHVELDGVYIYGGSPALRIDSTTNFKLVRSIIRGLAAPWSSRASMKYRGNSPYLVVAGNKSPRSHDWEIAFNEFTDTHDGLVLDTIKTLRFHHNRIDNINDDGIYLTLPPRDAVPEDVQIYENIFTRVYTVFAFAEHHAKNEIGPGVFIFRNVFDLRDGTYGWIAKDAATDAAPYELSENRIAGDHGNPTWDPLYFYNNTVLFKRTPQRGNFGLFSAIGTRDSKRRIIDNLFVQDEGVPGSVILANKDDVQIDGNLHWSRKGAPIVFDKLRAAGYAAHDLAGDPKLTDADHGDLRLSPGSAAIDAGVPVPKDWPDPLRAGDKGKPDVGALPAGAPMLKVGPAAVPP
jgi:hypothetical protein